MIQERYIVLKKSDVEGLDPKARAQLERLCNAVNFVRELRKKEPVKAIVVEHDWPEYEPTKQSILRRANGVRHSARRILAEMALGVVVAFVFMEAFVRLVTK
jgi:hypothetical protein